MDDQNEEIYTGGFKVALLCLVLWQLKKPCRWCQVRNKVVSDLKQLTGKFWVYKMPVVVHLSMSGLASLRFGWRAMTNSSSRVSGICKFVITVFWPGLLEIGKIGEGNAGDCKSLKVCGGKNFNQNKILDISGTEESSYRWWGDSPTMTPGRSWRSSRHC